MMGTFPDAAGGPASLLMAPLDDVSRDEEPVRAEQPRRHSSRGDRSTAAGTALAAAVGVWAVVSVAYAPTLAFRYGLYDDYRNAGARDLIKFDVGDGRPVSAVIHALLFRWADRFGEFSWPRAATVVLLGACACLLFRLLRRFEVSTAGSAGLAVCAAATVSTQVVAGWGVTLVVTPLALAAGAAGGWYAWQWAAQPLSASRNGLLGGALLIVGLCLYQPGGMAFWLVVFVAQARTSLSFGERFRRDARLGLLAGASLMAYFVIWKVGAALTNRSGARGKLVTDLGGKLRWFVDVLFIRAFHPYSIAGDRFATGVIVAVLGFVGIGLALRGRLADRALGLVSAAGCFPLAYLPNLATAENWPSGRSLVVLMPMAALAIALGALGLLEGFAGLLRPARRHASSRPGAAHGPSPTEGPPVGYAFIGRRGGRALWALLVCVIAPVILLRAQSNVLRYFVVSNAEELAAYEDAVRELAAQNPAEILLAPADWSDTIAPGLAYDEFGYPATAATWALEPIARSALRGTGYTGKVRAINRSDLATLPPGSVVLDAADVLATIDR